MALNTLLTGLEPRIAHIIRASNPKTILEAQIRIKRELQLSYFETQNSRLRQTQPVIQKKLNVRTQNFNTNQNNSQQQSYTSRPNYQQFSSNYNSRPNFYQNQSNTNNFSQQRPQFVQRPQTQRPQFQQNQRPLNNSQPRASVIQRNPNFNQRAHVVNYSDNDNFYPEEYIYSSIEQENAEIYPDQEETDIEYESNFPLAIDQNHPPIDQLFSELNQETQTLTIDDQENPQQQKLM